MDVRVKAYVYSRLTASSAGSNPVEDMDGHLFRLLCVP